MVDDEALGSVLISWYMSGYHTGYYLVCAQQLTGLLCAIKGIYSSYLQVQCLVLCSEEQWAFMILMLCSLRRSAISSNAFCLLIDGSP